MPEAVIVDALRTPIGPHGGSLKSVRPDDLAALVVRSVVERSKIDPALIDDVYLGAANQAGEDNRNFARMAALLAGAHGVVLKRCIATDLLAAIDAVAAGRTFVSPALPSR